LNILTSTGLDTIIFFDACRFSQREGDVKILNEEEISTFATSTHTSSLGLIISYIHKFSKAVIYVIGICIVKSSHSQNMSENVKKSADELIGLIQHAVC